MRRFGLDRKKPLSALSLGMQSAVNAIEGLASGAALTLFDEVHHGMNAPLRTLFYDTILDRPEVTGRTFILSTHLVSETAYLFACSYWTTEVWWSMIRRTSRHSGFSCDACKIRNSRINYSCE